MKEMVVCVWLGYKAYLDPTTILRMPIILQSYSKATDFN